MFKFKEKRIIFKYKIKLFYYIKKINDEIYLKYDDIIPSNDKVHPSKFWDKNKFNKKAINILLYFKNKINVGIGWMISLKNEQKHISIFF